MTRGCQHEADTVFSKMGAEGGSGQYGRDGWVKDEAPISDTRRYDDNPEKAERPRSADVRDKLSPRLHHQPQNSQRGL